ncbi:hypothetical protein PV08_00657 [Exophiala spinifera]|uniref:mRNA 3'-end-processing protein n=1 Tax=Exophiala spinifera TaxID=91928 RepID=A0A0D2A5P2_9EURO|nr:uncharacterized protein PV08_00657 [Exophiala spinifera]KIW20082.1 hypothetical protein PV08_00657 [Exophiala spinifera]
MASVVAESTPAAPESSSKTTNPSTTPTYNFSFTPFLRSNGIAALASKVPVCPDYAATGHCPRGRRCADRHPTPSQPPQHHYGRQNDNYVCKHWLKGLCKKGDACDYLHEYNLRKMSECQFYNQNGYCQNGDECLYVHVKEGSKLPLCEDYNKGFCDKGPSCGKRHVRRRLCEFYMAGFCPDGPNCKFGVHLKSGGSAVDNSVGEVQKRDRVTDLDRREEDSRKDFGWKGGRGKGGRWRNKRERRG